GLDLRDNPRRPAHGTAMGAALWRYSPGDDRFAPFTRLIVNVRGYRQVGPPRHVLAAQLTGSWTWTPEPGAMPYSLLQSLGGSKALRSFHSFRFRGRHLTALSIESRWRAREWLELVPFLDVG